MDSDRSQRRQERWDRRQERWDARRERWEHGPRPMGGIIFGLLVMGFGLLFLLRNLNIIYIDDVWQYWPVILIVIGASKLISPRGSHDIFPGLVIGGIGAYFLLNNLGIIYGNVWQYIWPLVFIALGASMLIKHMDGGDRKWPEGPVVAATDTGDRTLSIDLVFSGTKRKITSQEFAGGRIATVFGGAEIDLREAGTKLEELTIKADAVFGGIDLRVPETWDVEVRGAGVFGAVENRTRKPQVVGGVVRPRLIVRGDAVFGSVMVKN